MTAAADCGPLALRQVVNKGRIIFGRHGVDLPHDLAAQFIARNLPPGDAVLELFDLLAELDEPSIVTLRRPSRAAVACAERRRVG